MTSAFSRRQPPIATELTLDHRRPSSGLSSDPAIALGNEKFQLSPALLRDVRNFWFEHFTGPEDFILPGQKQSERWFVGSDEFDIACCERFGAILEAIRESGVKTGHEILEVARPSEPLDWVSLILLLDQMPRNCYRGSAAAVAFTFFDPIARETAIAAITSGIPETVPQLRWQFAYRKWFYLPFMHSEELWAHALATHGYELMRNDVHVLVEEADDAEPLELPQGNTQPEYRSRAAMVIRANAADACSTIDRWCFFEKKHMDIIKKFGRYPHRNMAMERTSTVEETEYLDNGGETFARPN